MTQHMPVEKPLNSFYLSQHCAFDSFFREQTRFALEKEGGVYDPSDGEKSRGAGVSRNVPAARR